jgi:uncharacterized protein YecA (UPF0149 family)
MDSRGHLYVNAHPELIEQKQLVPAPYCSKKQILRMKVKPNENCPCGSGKKFKRCPCHGGKPVYREFT